MRVAGRCDQMRMVEQPGCISCRTAGGQSANRASALDVTPGGSCLVTARPGSWSARTSAAARLSGMVVACTAPTCA